MLTSPDFKEILNLFSKYKVRYLVVGGYAVMKYTEPRYTKDLIKAKIAAGRPQDQIDAENLKKAEKFENE